MTVPNKLSDELSRALRAEADAVHPIQDPARLLAALSARPGRRAPARILGAAAVATALVGGGAAAVLASRSPEADTQQVLVSDPGVPSTWVERVVTASTTTVAAVTTTAVPPTTSAPATTVVEAPPASVEIPGSDVPAKRPSRAPTTSRPSGTTPTTVRPADPRTEVPQPVTPVGDEPGPTTETTLPIDTEDTVAEPPGTIVSTPEQTTFTMDEAPTRGTSRWVTFRGRTTPRELITCSFRIPGGDWTACGGGAPVRSDRRGAFEFKFRLDGLERAQTAVIVFMKPEGGQVRMTYRLVG